LSVLDVNGVSVPQILNDWAIDTVGQDYGWIRTDGVTQDISDCCITFKGLEPGREFELVLNQLLNGQWIQVDNKPIKVPGKSRVPLVVVPELDPPSVPLIEAVDALPINVNQVVSQVISADQTEIACSQTCIDSILAKVGVAGEVFVEVDGGGEVLLDGSSTVKLDAQSKDLKISVKPSDGSDAVEFSVALLRQQASSAGSDMSSNSSSRTLIYLLLAVLFIIIVGVVLQRRKSVKA
jgi:hypothetical protein